MTAAELTARMKQIETWDRPRCLEAWIAMTGVPPGARLSTQFLQKALIFELQCKALGGHSAAVRRQLKAGIRSTAKPTAVLTPGTQLVREWNGRVYRVDVLADGFEMDGQAYASLSAIAKRITGTDWSGPRFFGLRKRQA